MLKNVLAGTAVALGTLAVWPMTMHAQDNEPFPTAQAFAESKAAQQHVAAAMKMAGTDLVAEAKAFCTATGPQREALARQAAGLPPIKDYQLEPIRLFENLYYIGFNDVGMWVVSTSDGLILFDTLNSPDEARDVIVPGLKKLGLDPARIRYIVIGHGHNDHTGGAAYLQGNYESRIVMGGPDWDAILAKPRPDRPMPKKDMVATDGQKITVGDTTVTLALTPGHTPGTIAMLVPVKHRGQTSTAVIFSGSQMPTKESLNTFEHVFTDFARAQKAESALGGHPGILMNSLETMEAIGKNYPLGAHPLLMGPEKFNRYLSIMLECGKARLAALNRL
jgi:metallo-beta-lactamase class B